MAAGASNPVVSCISSNMCMLLNRFLQPSYLFQIHEIYEDMGNSPPQTDNHGIWEPTIGPHACHDFTPGVGASGKTWLCDGLQIHQVQQLPRNAQLYKTFSVYYACGAGFWVLRGDARCPPGNEFFQKLQFNYYHHPLESSYLTNAGEHNMLCVQPQDGSANLILPDIYHTPTTASHAQYGAVVGELPIFLALMAFTTSRDFVPLILPHIFAQGRWNTSHQWQQTSKFWDHKHKRSHAHCYRTPRARCRRQSVQLP
jgi:hypothetical protein